MRNSKGAWGAKPPTYDESALGEGTATEILTIEMIDGGKLNGTLVAAFLFEVGKEIGYTGLLADFLPDGVEHGTVFLGTDG